MGGIEVGALPISCFYQNVASAKRVAIIYQLIYIFSNNPEKRMGVLKVQEVLTIWQIAQKEEEPMFLRYSTS